MIFVRGWLAAVDFLTCIRRLLNVGFPMRRSLRFRVEFAPTRLSREHLRSAYEVIAPVARRVVRERPSREFVVEEEQPAMRAATRSRRGRSDA